MQNSFKKQVYFWPPKTNIKGFGIFFKDANLLLRGVYIQVPSFLHLNVVPILRLV